MKKSKTRIKVLFVSASLSSFVKGDLEILQKHFDVKSIQYRSKRDILKIGLETLKSDLTFSWFASSHAFVAVRLSKIFRKKSIVIVGGYEVARVPEIGYGKLLNPKSARRVKYVLRNADRVLAVDEGLKKDAIKNTGVTGENIQTVPTGYDCEKFKPRGGKENLVITVSLGDNWGRIRLKGLDTFVKSAEFLPEVRFLVIGLQEDALKKLQSLASSNVKFIGPLPRDKLISYYQRAKVYCQLSMREGLPNALCEAMLCECKPVGTNVQGVRTAIGDTGFYVPYGDEKATAMAIKEAMESAEDLGKKARQRIISQFPLKKREERLHDIITGLVEES